MKVSSVPTIVDMIHVHMKHKCQFEIFLIVNK